MGILALEMGRLIAIGCVLATAASAGAQAGCEGGDCPPASTEAVDPNALSQDAMLRFLDNDYEGALDLWQRSYAVSHDPETLRDVAQALEALGRYDEALRVSRDALPLVSEATREVLSHRVERLEVRAAQERERQANVDQLARERTELQRQLSTRGHDFDGWGGVIVAGSGVGLAIAASVIGMLALDASSRGTMGCMQSSGGRICLDSARGQLEDASNLALASDLMFVGAGLAIASGLVWMIVEIGNDAPSPSARLGLRPFAGGGSLDLSGRF